MSTEWTKSKIGRWVDGTMKGKFDNFVGSRKKSSTNTSTKITNEIPVLSDTDEKVDLDVLDSVKPAELNSKIAESVYENEMTRPPITLTGIDLGLLFSNIARKQYLEDVISDERDIGKMIQRHIKLLNVGSEE